MFQKASEFLKEVRIESTKVTWPSRNELRESTVVVVIAVTFIAAFTAVVDRVVSFLMTLII